MDGSVAVRDRAAASAAIFSFIIDLRCDFSIGKWTGGAVRIIPAAIRASEAAAPPAPSGPACLHYIRPAAHRGCRFRMNSCQIAEGGCQAHKGTFLFRWILVKTADKRFRSAFLTKNQPLLWQETDTDNMISFITLNGMPGYNSSLSKQAQV